MSAQTEFDLGSLIWVKGEIDQALDKSRQCLNKFATTGDNAELKFTQTHLHQVRGAVEMVGLAGAARFAEEMEVSVGMVERGEAPPATLSAVAEASTSLAQYLESLVNGAPDLALKLLPSYRRVRQTRGETQTSGADLFFPPLSGNLPAGLSPLPLDPATLTQLLKNSRSRFEAGLLKWLKGDQREGGQWMMQAFLAVARSQSSSLQRGFWWAASAMVEGSMDNKAMLDVDLKPLFGRLNQQLKRLTDGGAKVAERLFRDVLYVVAKMDTQSPHCAGVRRAFELSSLLPAGALEDDAQQLAAMQTARELRELINQAKDNWSRVGGGSTDKLASVQKQLADLSARGAKLGINGFKPLAVELARTVGALAGVPEEKQALEIATALLLLENALMVFPEQSTEFPAQAAAMQARLLGSTSVPEVTLLDEVSRRAQERLLMTQVAQEIQANLAQIEQVLDDFFRDSATRGELAGTDGSIRQIRGALTMLDERDALTLLNACADIVKRNQAEDYAAPGDELEFLAEAFSSLGFYIDAIKREDADRARIIAPWLQRIRGEAPVDAGPTEAELIAAELEVEPDTEPAAAAHAEEEPVPQLEAEHVAEAPMAEPREAEAAAAAPGAVSDAAVDAELLEVYLEEAVEVLATISEHMQAVREQPTNRDAMTVVRRGFHTLKGSGRMVGLNQLGEVAWAVEQVLNKWLQEERRATPLLLQLIDDTSASFSRWVEELKQSGSALVEASALFAMAERLKSGDEPEEAAAPAPEPAHTEAAAASVAEPEPLVEPAPVADLAVVAPEHETPAHAEPGHEQIDLAPTHEEAPLDLILDEPSPVHIEAPSAEPVHELDLSLDEHEPAAADHLAIGHEEVAAAPVHEHAQPDTALDLPADVELTEPVATDDELGDLTIGDVVISRVLFGIFLDEAYRHFATLNDAFIDFGARGEVRPAFVHAAHTLCGIANTTGFTTLGELGHAIELALVAHQQHEHEPSHADREALSVAIDKVGVMLGQISHYHMPGEELQTIAMLATQANRLKDLVEARAAQIVEAPASNDVAVEPLAEVPAEPAEAAVPAHADIRLDELDLDLDHEAADALSLDLPIEPIETAPAAELIEPEQDAGLDLELTLDAEPEHEHEHEHEHEQDIVVAPPTELVGHEEAHDLDIELHADVGDRTEEHVASPVEPAEEESVLELDEALALGAALAEPPMLLEEVPVGEHADIGEHAAADAEAELSLAETLVPEAELMVTALAEPGDEVEVPAPASAGMDEALLELSESLSIEDGAGVPLLLDESPDFVEVGDVALLEPELAQVPLAPESEPITDEMAAEEMAHLEAPHVELADTPLTIEPALLSGEEVVPGEQGIGHVELAPVDEAIVVEPHAVAEVPAQAAPTAAAVELATLLGGLAHPTPADKDGVGSVALPGGDRLAEITVLDELDEQLLPIFLEEAQELMPQVAADLRKLREEGQAAAAMDSLKRSLHTLKGSARMAGAMRLGEATHNLESRLLNAGESLLPALVDELDVDYDAIVELHDRLVNGEPEAVAAEGDEAAPQVVGNDLAEVIAAPIPAAGPRAAGPAQPLGLVDPDMGKTTVRVRADLVDRLVNQAGEVAIARTRIESEMLALKRSLLDLTDNVARLRSQLREIEIQAESQMQSRMAHSHDLPDFDPLEFDRFSRLQELTRFMAESVNDVATVQHNLLKNLDESSSALQQQSRLTRDLQQELMRVRMVPFSSLSERMYRIVRQTGKETGKKVNLELRGGRVEIDRSVLEKMVSPFEHMLRNAIDHGLETPEVRTSNGKTEFGEILVEARQEGNELVLTLRDDGAGLNLDRIRAKGLEKGLLEQGLEYSDSQIMHLIFAAGFSTASEVTQLSGRGIGMDVVKAEIEDLGGRVEVNSTAGQGTVFTIHLPLTLAVTQTVLIKVGEKTYAIPSVMVEQVQELKIGPLEKLYQSRQAEWMGNVYPFHYLPRLLGDNERTPEQKRYNTIILLRSGIQRIALHVDELIRNQEVVVKNIGPQLVRVAGVAGATVLGNGEIVLILNPLALSQRRAEAPVADFDASVAATMPTPEEMLQTAPVVMVVDDSLTVRKITGRLLAREGYQVVTAKDGVDALQQLQDVRPAVMLLDVEMPRMDGFELTRNLRVNADTRDIPIIMITSRTADKHKNYAFELGVNVFLGKPYQEDELLEHIRRLIGEEMPIA